MPLTITTLGEFRLLRDDEELSPAAWKNQKNRHLCQLLLTHRRNPPHREQLLEWLWPGLPPASADRSLRVAISQLRRALEPDLPPRADSAFLLITPSGYAWNPHADYTLDADRFDHLCSEFAVNPTGDDPYSRLALGEEAKALYRGDFLAEEAYTDWASAEWERLRETNFALLNRRGRYYNLYTMQWAAETG
ncbi:MAG: winged helix-turn-helix domain-containing protein [Chloroflexi bacterium]|nr:winged helix-turn-helix domain-containing protein [Chloroflexota bacterium]